MVDKTKNHFAKQRFCGLANQRQRGAALLVGLVILLIVTLVGISSMETVSVDEKVVSSMHSSALAYHGAESALAACEAAIQTGDLKAYRWGTLPDDWRTAQEVSTILWENPALKIVDYSEAAGSAVDAGLKTDAKCFGEYMGDATAGIDIKEFYRKDNPGSRLVYRTASKSDGGDSNAKEIMESIFICAASCDQTNVQSYLNP